MELSNQVAKKSLSWFDQGTSRIGLGLLAAFLAAYLPGGYWERQKLNYSRL
jgi:hypothetical protein